MKHLLLILLTLGSLATGMAHEDHPHFWATEKPQGAEVSEEMNPLKLSHINLSFLIAELSKNRAVANRLFNVGDDLKSVNVFRNLLPNQIRSKDNHERIHSKQNSQAFKVGF